MPFPLILALVVCLGIYLIPVWLLRRQATPRAQDYVVSSEPTPPGVFQNSSIAGALRLATLGPLFAWGAGGDFWPAIVVATAFGLGVGLLYLLRRPMLAFLDDALIRDRSITVHEFIARRHGNDRRVRLLAAALTMFALLGLAGAEALALVALLKPVLAGHAALANLLVCGLLIVAALLAMRSGNSGVMRATQSQLGLIYLGLFGATVLLLYVPISELKPIPPSGILAIAWVAAVCVLMPIYRRSRYVDTSPIAGDPASGRGSWAAGAFRRFQKVLNPLITALAVVVIVLAVMEFVTVEMSTIARDSLAALQIGTRMSGVGLITLCLLPLIYPMVDVTNWQRIAAFAKDGVSSDVETGRRHAGLATILRRTAVESSLVWLFVAMLGAIAVVSADAPGGADTMPALLAQLVSQQDTVAAMVLSLLLVSVLAIALSAMSFLFSAGLCTLRYDILPALRPQPAADKAQPAEQALTTRRTMIAGGGLTLAIVVAYLAGSYLQIGVTGGFLALLFAVFCAQLALAPLILGPLIGRTGGVSPGWALVILGVGAASGLGAVTVYLVTGVEPWLWAAVPACLGSGLLLFTLARLWPGKTARAG